MPRLAIRGGNKVRNKLFPDQSTLGIEEQNALMQVLESGCLTGYQGNASKAFYGGPWVRKLEETIQEKFRVKYAIACNSATSGLFIACKMLGLIRFTNKKVIVTPFSMTCSATMPIEAGGLVKFADIDPIDFCINPTEMTAPTEALFIVDLFGNIYDYERINKYCKEHGIIIIEDAAQAIGSHSMGKFAGTFGDIGVFSFNQGKAMTCGEGGMIVTNDDDLAMMCRKLMNHGEAYDNDLEMQRKSIPTPIIGFNLRMTEMQAAVAYEQLKKLDYNNHCRSENAIFLQDQLSQFPGIKTPKSKRTTFNSFYCVPFHYNEKSVGIHRDIFIEAVKAELEPCRGREHEGVPLGNGYIRPIYKMPVFSSQPEYRDLRLPVVEYMYKDGLFLIHRMHGSKSTKADLWDIVNAFEKVYENINQLLEE